MCLIVVVALECLFHVCKLHIWAFIWLCVCVPCIWHEFELYKRIVVATDTAPKQYTAHSTQCKANTNKNENKTGNLRRWMRTVHFGWIALHCNASVYLIRKRRKHQKPKKFGKRSIKCTSAVYAQYTKHKSCAQLRIFSVFCIFCTYTIRIRHTICVFNALHSRKMTWNWSLDFVSVSVSLALLG